MFPADGNKYFIVYTFGKWKEKEKIDKIDYLFLVLEVSVLMSR